MRTARVPADRWPVATTAGCAAAALLADVRVQDLLESRATPIALRTARTAEFLRWRYGLAELGYRALAIDDDPAAGLALFRLRRRGEAVEVGVSDVLVPHGAEAAARQADQPRRRLF